MSENDRRVSDFGSTGVSPSQSSLSRPERKRPAHGVFSELSKPTIVFVTVCTKDRSRWLADTEVHGLLCKVWREASAWLVGRYVVMPDHIHLFATPGQVEIDLDNWVKYWKRQFTRVHSTPKHRWQADHWDRRLRDDESYAEKWDYVRANPVRHGLVTKPGDWPFQGELNALTWY